MRWEIEEVQNVDGKVGNGFIIVIRQTKNRVFKKDVYVADKKGDFLRNKDVLIADLETGIGDYKQELQQKIIITHKLESLVEKK